MAQNLTWQDRSGAFLNRRAARKAGRARITTGFAMQPEPLGVGLVVKGRQLVAGEFLFSGMRVSDPLIAIWDIRTENEDVIADLHSCEWLDDLAAVGDEAARARAQTWIFGWITRYGAGTGPGWTPDITARRLAAWIGHSDFLLRGQSTTQTAEFMQSLGRQTLFLSRRWHVTPSGLPRIAALAGTITANLALDAMTTPLDKVLAALAASSAAHIDAEGGVRSRNPQELLAVLSHLVTCKQVLDVAGQPLPAAMAETIAKIVPVLRGLRHADGGLARFHGGGRGAEGRLDAALAAAGVKTPATQPKAMGFARLTAGRTSVIVDAAAPPVGPASRDAHASTLALEVTSGRRPLFVSCGSGARFGKDWRRASRATPSHSTLGLEGVSSSHLGQTQDEWLTEVPGLVRAEVTRDITGRRLDLSHNGYQRSHGLTHARMLQLSADARRLTGEDLLTTLDKADEAQFDHMLDQTLRAGVPFAIRFHLHPDVTCAVTRDNSAVTLWLKSGEIWIFQHDGAAQLSVSPSVYLENGQLKPRPAQQVVLSGNALAYATRVRWSLAKAENTPLAVRDLAGTFPLDVADQI